MNKVVEFFKKYIDIIIPLVLLGLCYLFLFYKANGYPLIDVDETRYAAMAREILERRDWLTMYLNHNIFYEKPPLYFWMLAGSYKMFGGVSEAAARFPVALVASFGVFYTYYFGKKVISRLFGFVSSLILLSSVMFLILTRVAILDMLIATFEMATVYSGFLTYFCEDKNKKYFWWSAYVFSALAVLSKGLPGVIIPFGVLFTTALVTGKLKEMFKPVNFIVGAALFFLVSLPWHVMMYQAHGMAFINDYIIKQHFARFIDSKNIGRVEPFWYFIPVMIVGFAPWIITLAGAGYETLNKIKRKIKTIGLKQAATTFLEEARNNKITKLLTVLSVYLLFVFGFFSSSSTKLPTYILPLMPAAALLTGYCWNEYLANDNKNKLIKISSAILAVILLLSSLVGLTAVQILEKTLTSDVLELVINSSVWFLASSLALFVSIFDKKKFYLFATHILFMLGVVVICVNNVFPVVVNGGEMQLIDYALTAKQVKNSSLTTYNFGVRSSTLFYYGKKVNFVVEPDLARLKTITKDKNAFVIVKSNYVDELKKVVKFHVVKEGEKYALLDKFESPKVLKKHTKKRQHKKRHKR